MKSFICIFIVLTQISQAQISTGGGGELSEVQCLESTSKNEIVYKKKIRLDKASRLTDLEHKFFNAIKSSHARCEFPALVFKRKNIVDVYINLIKLDGLNYLTNQNIEAPYCRNERYLLKSDCAIQGARKELTRFLYHPDFHDYVTNKLIPREGTRCIQSKSMQARKIEDYFLQKLRAPEG